MSVWCFSCLLVLAWVCPPSTAPVRLYLKTSVAICSLLVCQLPPVLLVQSSLCLPAVNYLNTGFLGKILQTSPQTHPWHLINYLLHLPVHLSAVFSGSSGLKVGIAFFNSPVGRSLSCLPSKLNNLHLLVSHQVDYPSLVLVLAHHPHIYLHYPSVAVPHVSDSLPHAHVPSYVPLSLLFLFLQ